MRVGYARVSTDEQTIDLQLDALRAAGCTRVFQDMITGQSRKRPGLDHLLASLQPGDTLVVWRVDRLGRNFHHLVTTAGALKVTGVALVSLTEGLDTATPIGQAIYRMICIFTELELTYIRERTRAGLSAAKARGQVLGRRCKLQPSDLEPAKAFMAEFGATQAAREFGVARSTLYRAIRWKDEPTASTSSGEHLQTRVWIYNASLTCRLGRTFFSSHGSLVL